MAWLRSVGWCSQSSRDGDEMDVDEPIEHSQQQQVRKSSVPLSDEWFAELDETFDTISNTFEELKLSQSIPEEDPYMDEAEQGLADIQKELMDCLASLQNAERGLRASNGDHDGNGNDDRESELSKHSKPYGYFTSGPFFAQTPSAMTRGSEPWTRMAGTSRMSAGDEVMKQVFRWWQPSGPDYINEVTRPDGFKIMEVD